MLLVILAACENSFANLEGGANGQVFNGRKTFTLLQRDAALRAGSTREGAVPAASTVEVWLV
jgi:hypothetical protein